MDLSGLLTKKLILEYIDFLGTGKIRDAIKPCAPILHGSF
jgi:hypothetical protein